MHEIPLTLATSNKNKLAQFQKWAPAGVQAEACPVMFDEAAIKETIGIATETGNEYVRGMSQAKWMVEKDKLSDQKENGKDSVVLVSDAVLLINDNGTYRAINKEGLSQM